MEVLADRLLGLRSLHPAADLRARYKTRSLGVLCLDWQRVLDPAAEC